MSLRQARRICQLQYSNLLSLQLCPVTRCTTRSLHSAPPDIGKALAEQLQNDPDSTMQLLLRNLPREQRLLLIARLGSVEDITLNDKYVDELLKQSDKSKDGLLNRSELKVALSADRNLNSGQTGSAQTAPSVDALGYVALAAGIPLIGFGFLDNFIMIVAGEKIESSFGVALGLSTMAAAGLGNLISDLAGLGIADQIEAQFKKLRLSQSPPLSEFQKGMLRTRVAKMGGMSVGISIGCLLGMVPLLWLHPSSEKKD